MKLEEIRLLYLDTVSQAAGSLPLRISGRLQTMSLLEKMDCNVLSYILGDPNPISGISVDDGTSAPVAANLLQATLSVFVDGVSLVSSRVVSSDGTDRTQHSI